MTPAPTPPPLLPDLLAESAGGHLTPGGKSQTAPAAKRSAPARGAGRQTNPWGFNPYSKGGAGIIPRRGLMDPRIAYTRYALDRLLNNSPMRLLSYLPDLHPGVGMATWNVLRLGCPADGLRIVAMKPLDGPRRKKPSYRRIRPANETLPSAAIMATQDDEGTAILDNLWDSLPNEVGGLHGLQVQLMLSALFAGMCCVEAVPGKLLQGLSRVWPVDPLTIEFGRTNPNDDVTPYQIQPNYMAGPAPNLRPLNPHRFIWRLVDPGPGEVHGRAPYATALNEALADLALMQDLRDVVHHAAWPRNKFKFNFDNAHKTAVEVLKYTDPTEINDFVWEQFYRYVSYVQTLRADDDIVVDGSADADIIAGGNFGGMEQVLAFLRQRLGQSLKSFPTLMGINERSGNTQNSVEWSIFAEGVETLRYLTIEVVLMVADYHFTLLGHNFKAKAIFDPIRKIDSQTVENTLAVRIKNHIAMRDQNWESQDDASVSVTGSGSVGPAPVVATPELDPATGAQAGGGGGGSSASKPSAGGQHETATGKTSDPQSAGEPTKTKEERQQDGASENARKGGS